MLKLERGNKLNQEIFKLICIEFNNNNNNKKIAMARHFFYSTKF
jgi:hypothetical protein